jgi:ribonuclease HI
MKPEAARQLHQSVFLPKVTYAADIWWEAPYRNPSDMQNQGAVGFTKKHQAAQHISALNITGALCTSPTDVLDTHAGIFPVELKLRKAHHQAAIRLASAPREHPMRKLANREGKKAPVMHKSPLHQLFIMSKVQITDILPNPVTTELPTQLKKLHARIEEQREEAKSQERDWEASIKIYMDGSMKDGAVGAAAVLVREGREDRVLKVHLGPDKEHEVYEAEVLGQLGLQLLAWQHQVDNVVIFTDSQAAIRTLASGRAEHIAYAFADLNSLLTRVLTKHWGIRIDTRWIPGHEGVEGNKKADEVARQAVEEGGSPKKDLPKHLQDRIPVNPTAAKCTFKARMEKTWKDKMKDMPRKEQLEKLDPTYPSHDFFNKAKDLPR